MQTNHTVTVRTSEMQLWSIEEENGQGLDQVRTARLETVYCLVVGQAGPFLAVEVDITEICCRTHSWGSRGSTMHDRRLTEEKHQAT